MKKIIITALLALGGPAIALAASPALPSISLFGGPVTVHQGTSYQEPGYTASSPTDGDVTHSVVVSGALNTSAPGNYTRAYNVEDSAGLDAPTKTRSVTVENDSIINPCSTNGTCPCPISYETDPGVWKSCVMALYPKFADGSTHVCRLKPLQWEETKITCDADQSGLEQMRILKNGTEIRY